MTEKRRIGDLLIEYNMITSAMLSHALEVQKQSYKPLGKIFLDLGYITQEELTNVLAKQFGSLYINPKYFTIRNKELLSYIPENLARKFNCFPYDSNNDELKVVMDDPFNTEAIHELRRITGKQIRPVHANKNSIIAVLDKLFGLPKPNQESENSTPNPVPTEIDSSFFQKLENVLKPTANQEPAPVENRPTFKANPAFSPVNQITLKELLAKPKPQEAPIPLPGTPPLQQPAPVLERKRPWANEPNKTNETESTATNNNINDSNKSPIPHLLFDNFVVAPSNQLAWAAAQNVAAHPGVGFNPLFIYGGVGLGKTHLSNAIGNSLLQQYPDARICYITINTFIRELIEAYEHNRIKDFQLYYRNLDTLIIDDVQFLSGQERIQEEFFYIFEQLYRTSGQIIITSDRLPRQIDRLEDRLRSRFEGGLIVDVQNPDLETRIAIFRKKMAAKGLYVSDEIARLVANRLSFSVRELEGMANRIIAQTQLMNQPLSVELIENILDNFAPENTVPKPTESSDDQPSVTP